MNKYETVNTFKQMPSVAQVSSYLVFLAQTIVFYTVAVPNFVSEIALIIFAIIFSISLLCLITSTLICSIMDPSDDLMIQYRNGERDKLQDQISTAMYCDFCRSYVKQSSRHCRVCNRCVSDFDHHCMWINNCIGGKNYKWFIFMMASTQINLSIYVAGIVFISVENNWTQFLAGIIVSWIVLIVVVVFWFLLLNLIILHIYLACNSLTTYQFIVAQRVEKEIKQRKAQEKAEKIKEIKLNKNKNLHKQSQEENSHNHISNKALNKSEQQKTQMAIINNRQDKNNRNTTDQRQKTGSKIQQGNIFDEELDIVQKEPTQKSQGQVSNNDYHNNHEREQEQSNNSVHFSQFFLRNKSLKILVGNSQADRPKNSSRVQQKMKYNSSFDHRKSKQKDMSKFSSKQLSKPQNSKEILNKKNKK